jgi:endonuclease/exonuclease/phosphatase family metal-dependent hydrolase
MNDTCGDVLSLHAGVSKHYVAQLELAGGIKVALIGAHLLARPQERGDRCARREAQAAVLRAIAVDRIASGSEVVILGDFNDFDREVPDSSNNLPVSAVLQLLKTGRMTPSAHSTPPAGTSTLCASAQLVNMCAMVGYSRYSTWSDNNHDCIITGGQEMSLLDHVLITEGLSKAVTATSIPKSYGPVRGGQQMCKDDVDYVSDHWPVVVDIDLHRIVRSDKCRK